MDLTSKYLAKLLRRAYFARAAKNIIVP